MVRAELPRLYRVASRLTQNLGEAEDLVAETLYLAAKGWNGFDGRYPAAWLIRIMNNAFFRRVEVERKRPTLPLELVGEDQSAIDPNPDLLNRIRVEQILEEMKHLSPEHQMVLTLCDIEEMGYDEAALALDIPRGTLCSRLFRARKALVLRCKEILEER